VKAYKVKIKGNGDIMDGGKFTSLLSLTTFSGQCDAMSISYKLGSESGEPNQAEKSRAAWKNRIGTYGDSLTRPEKGPMKLYIGSLHFNITEEMLRGIFEPFGRIHSIQLIKDAETDQTKGYGFITYNDAEDAKKAMGHMNGFELAGQAMKVGHVTEQAPVGPTMLDQDDARARFDLGATDFAQKCSESVL